METSLTLAELVVKDGPAWVFVVAIGGIIIYAVYKLISIYEKSNDKRINAQDDMNHISGQMVEQMNRSNTVLEAVQQELSLMNAANERLLDALTKSQDRSASMAASVSTMADRIEQLYEKLVLQH